eukprot:GHVP01020191.1.p2 GENE.GHVP01020191.1~~GHVP01020191.1.p2  ORF type:complete len:121 (-),score=10.31 GHVP01020191.1:67-429(-)
MPGKFLFVLPDECQSQQTKDIISSDTPTCVPDSNAPGGYTKTKWTFLKGYVILGYNKPPGKHLCFGKHLDKPNIFYKLDYDKTVRPLFDWRDGILQHSHQQQQQSEPSSSDQQPQPSSSL